MNQSTHVYIIDAPRYVMDNIGISYSCHNTQSIRYHLKVCKCESSVGPEGALLQIYEFNSDYLKV